MWMHVHIWDCLNMCLAHAAMNTHEISLFNLLFEASKMEID